MTAIEIALGVTSALMLVGFVWWFSRHWNEPDAGKAAWFIIATFVGTVWFVARLWGFA